MFSLRSLSLAATAAAALAAAPLAASALGTTPPVAVTSCSADAQPALGFTAFTPVPAQDDAISLSFVNKTPVAARHIELLVNYDGTDELIDNVGTFAPGVRIDRSLETLPYVNAADVTCKVAKVEFNDGTTWNALAQISKTTALR